MGSWSKGNLVWDFIVEETRVDILGFYLCKHGMILVHRLEKLTQRVLTHVFQSRVVKDYKTVCVVYVDFYSLVLATRSMFLGHYK